MNLREHLRSILPEILPYDPEQAIKGTELIRLVRLRLGEGYSDATLRYHFSILSYDSTSPIAKVDQGQGYYQRTKKPVGVLGSGRMLFGGFEPEQGDAAITRFQRFLAIYERLCVLRGQQVFQLNGSAGIPPEVKGQWDLPDLVSAEWDLESGPDESLRFDRSMMDLRRHLGCPETLLTGIQLKMGLTLDNVASEFFQALSASRWALMSELVIIEPLSDEALVEALRGLGHEYGVGITSLGLSLDQLDELPSSRELRLMGLDQFEKVQEKMRPQRITLAAPRQRLDWQTLSNLRKKYDSVSGLVRWLQQCLHAERPVQPGF